MRRVAIDLAAGVDHNPGLERKCLYFVPGAKQPVTAAATGLVSGAGAFEACRS
jgi:hypothetical protein